MEFQKIKELKIITKGDYIYQYNHVIVNIDADFLRVFEDDSSGTYFPLINVINFTFVVEDKEV